jgi:hypothetical protein
MICWPIDAAYEQYNHLLRWAWQTGFHVDYNLEDSKIINMPHEERKIRWKKDG